MSSTSRAVIFGGAGYIGTMLAQHFAKAGRFSEVVIADLRAPAAQLSGIRFVECDVRKPIALPWNEPAPQWIFNFAAVHREPGHQSNEYFDTNLAAARHVCAWAEEVGCNQIFFTSSIATYGPTNGATTEQTPTYPRTPYGISKLCAELIHEGWQKREPARRLVTVRPGVIYGPGDPGNILRMIQAVKRGYFFFPGSTAIRKSYGYIFGLIDSIEFMLARSEPLLTYNYVEERTEPIGELVHIVRRFLGARAPVISMPLWLLAPAADAVQWLTGGRSPIHPVRVRKAATPTHIVPELLQKLDFPFRYDFARSLEHWRDTRPEDFV